LVLAIINSDYANANGLFIDHFRLRFSLLADIVRLINSHIIIIIIIIIITHADYVGHLLTFCETVGAYFNSLIHSFINTHNAAEKKVQKTTIKSST